LVIVHRHGAVRLQGSDIAVVVTGTFFRPTSSGFAGDDHHLIHATFRLRKLDSSA
jgi:hypothetical protein